MDSQSTKCVHFHEVPVIEFSIVVFSSLLLKLLQKPASVSTPFIVHQRQQLKERNRLKRQFVPRSPLDSFFLSLYERKFHSFYLRSQKTKVFCLFFIV